jgi:hypothetical protein
MRCKATADNHCCWLGASVCEHFNSDLADNKFCSLRTELGSWDLVHEDPRYAPQRKFFEGFGTSLCGDYPIAGETCGECGEVGVSFS